MSLVNLSHIALTGSGRSGVPYTNSEHKLALDILTQVTGMLGRPVVGTPEISDEVQAAIGEAVETSKDVVGICRSAFNKVADAHFDDDGNPTEVGKFPKKRDWTSIGLLFRHAASDKQLKGAYTAAEIDSMFKAYWKKAVKKTA